VTARIVRSRRYVPQSAHGIAFSARACLCVTHPYLSSWRSGKLRLSAPVDEIRVRASRTLHSPDEVFLCRVVDVLASGAGETADLEDCYQLDVVRVPIVDLRARRLRVVTPARGETATGFTRP
jgi:hypothetical protein